MIARETFSMIRGHTRGRPIVAALDVRGCDDDHYAGDVSQQGRSLGTGKGGNLPFCSTTDVIGYGVIAKEQHAGCTFVGAGKVLQTRQALYRLTNGKAIGASA